MSIATLPRINPGCAGIRMTPEEFDAVEAEPGYRYHLINGVLIVCPPAGIGERDPNDELSYLLRLYQRQHPRGSALNMTVSEQDVRTGDNRRRADRAIWAGLGRLPDLERDVPTIVVEFVSAGMRAWHRDYIAKRHEYLNAGVSEYWIIDRFGRSMLPEEPERVIPAQGSYRTDRLPGFELQLAALLALADRWTNADDID